MGWMKRVMIVGASGSVVVLGLYGGLLLALNTGLGPWALQETAARAGIAPRGAFHCERMTVTPALRVTLHGVSLRWRDARQAHTLTLGRVAIDTPAWEIVRTRRMAVRAVDGRLAGPNLAVEGLEVRFAGPLFQASTGTSPHPVGELQIGSARMGQLVVAQVHGPILQTDAGYRVEPFTMRAYSGQLQGSLTVELSPAPRLALALDASDLLLGDLDAFSAEMFRGARGALHGTIQLRSTPEGLESLDGTFAVNRPGGTIGSSFLQGLLPYLPRTAERERLRQVIARGALVPFQSGSVRVDMTDPQRIQAVLNMAIPEYNLVLSDVTMDIRFEHPDVLRQLMTLLGGRQ